MHCPPPGHIISTLFLTATVAAAQNFVGLDFSHNVQSTNAAYPNNSTLGPAYYAGLDLNFLNVADGVDARVEIIFQGSNYLISEGYEFVGFIPDYNQQGTAEAQGDLGVYYRSTNGSLVPVTGGISYQISFYESGSNFGTSKMLTDFRFLIYDHDGEPGQAESIRTYGQDGFVGYQLNDGSDIHMHDEGGTYRFDSGGMNKSEINAEGGFIAYYHNTSSIRFDMFATTQPWLPQANNGIFGAFDGDLSVINGNTNGFEPYIAVPESSTSLLLAGAASLAMLRRKRPLG